ncbi:PH domain-containing protein [Streptomyces sp. NPDC048258]|uniref:PH domain-containing protein n=1 Tax=Streptomyces sp. NPDC048258 TaxID=3365527 RepID=UPI003723BA16
MSARALPRDYRIKPGRTAVVFGVMGVGSLAALTPVWTDETIPGWVKLLVTGVLLAFFGWLVIAARRCATSVDLKGIRVRTMVRTRRLAWEDVQDIRAVPNPSAHMAANAPKVIAYAYGADGKRVQLMYVDDIHVAVDREIEVIRAAWAELRGEGWEPSAEAERRIRRRDRREARAFGAMAWFSGLVLLGLIVFLLFLFAGG